MSQFTWRDFFNEAIKNSMPRPKSGKIYHRFSEDFNSGVWTMADPKFETPKFKKVKQLLIDSATDAVRVKTWYQIYKPGQTYGIGVVDGVITDHPDRQFEGYTFDINKAHFETVKICEQILL